MREATAKWFVLLGTTETGPFTETIIHSYLENGDLVLTDMCWREGFSDWIPLGRTVEFAPRLLSVDHAVNVPDDAVHESYKRPKFFEEGELQQIGRLENSASESQSTLGGNYISRHWRGELSLPKSYWLNSYGLTLLLVVIGMGIAQLDFTIHPSLTSSLLITFWLLLAVSQIWLTVGIWRSARKYSVRYPDRRGWGTAAMVLSSIGFLSTASLMVREGVPQITGFMDVISAANQERAYTLRILRNASEIELAGPLDFGISIDFEKMIKEYPTVKIVQLNSNGGRLAEAEKLKDLVLRNNLDTYVGVSCQSACVTVFVAGHNRFISKTATLGLHEPYFPGLNPADLAATIEETKRFYYSRGIDGGIIERGFAVKHDDIWNPTHELLFSSRLVTGYANSDDVAITLAKPSNIDEGLEVISKIPIYAAIKEKYPDEYPAIEKILREGLLKGSSTRDLRTKLMPFLAAYYQKSLPTASIASIDEFLRIVAAEQEAVLKVGAVKCMAYMKGDTNGYSMSDIPAELTAKELEVGERLIRSTGSYQGPAIDGNEIQEQMLQILSRASQSLGLSGEQFAQGLDRKLNNETNCKVFIALYRELVNLEPNVKPILLRYFVQNMQ